jgi:crotonobetainyl-CoA:carnitine CoA-transferase CaiB-like acyl-CoA transferase
MGSAHPLNAPYQAYPTADGWINVGAANQSNWLRLLDAIEAPELAEEPRFADNPGRMGNLDELTAVLSAIFRRRSTADWLAVLERAGVPAGPVLTIAEMHDHPQTRARDMVVKVEHEKAGPVETLGLPIKFSRTPGSVRRGAPTFGQDSRAILAELGYDEEAVERLAATGAIG